MDERPGENAIRRYRRVRYLTLKEAGAALKVAPGTVCRWEYLPKLPRNALKALLSNGALPVNYNNGGEIVNEADETTYEPGHGEDK